MPQTVVDADLWTVNVQCAADGDAVDGASQLLPAQDLSDRSRWLHNRTIESVGGDLLVPMIPVSFGLAARWAFGTAGASLRYLVNTSVAGADEAVIPLPTLHNCTFDEVEVSLHGDFLVSGPHAGLPGTMPRITLYHIDLTTGAETAVGNAVDGSAGVAAYESAHVITLAHAAQTMDENSAFYISLRGESGANAMASYLHVFGMRMHVLPA